MLELRALLRGEARLSSGAQLEALNPRTGAARITRLEEIALLGRISAEEYVSPAQLQEEENVELGLIAGLLSDGLLTYENDPVWRELESVPWHSVARLFHASCLFEANVGGGDLRDDFAPSFELRVKQQDAAADVERFIARNGPPPESQLSFRTRDRSSAPIDLPVDPEPEDPFFQTLLRRRTRRTFSTEPVDLDRFSTLLRWTLGVQGTIQLSESYHALLKTSPSGGATHPIEGYPVVLGVDGLEPGIYHYNAFRHSLELLRTAPRDALSGLLVALASGQDYVGKVAFAVLLTARLGRNFWKYPQVCRTYGVVLQDAGHLSQSLYLAATRLELGVFYTAAVSGHVARASLGIETAVDAPLGLCGFGLPAAETSDGETSDGPTVRPFTPRTEKELPEDVEVRWVDSVEPPKAPSGRDVSNPLPGESYFRHLRISPTVEEE